jgi:hypothetical protein
MTGPAVAGGVRGAAVALSFAAAPSFALLALLTAGDNAPGIMCLHGAGPLGSMSLMYGLMALFHLPPWLRLGGGGSGRSARRAASKRRRQQGPQPVVADR